VSAIHIICHRDERGQLKGLSCVPGSRSCHLSECWDLNDREASELRGGWVYFHATKKKRSEFGGRILDTAIGERKGAAIPLGIVFTLEARREGHGQSWRGQDHGRAWTGGVVENSLPHEIE
jgi:hypothetical protein